MSKSKNMDANGRRATVVLSVDVVVFGDNPHKWTDAQIASALQDAIAGFRQCPLAVVGDDELFVEAAQRIEELEKDAARLDWMQFHGASIGWSSDGEMCSIVWIDGDDEKRLSPFDNWRAAIDAAMNR